MPSCRDSSRGKQQPRKPPPKNSQAPLSRGPCCGELRNRTYRTAASAQLAIGELNHWRQEAVTPPRERLNEDGVVSGISQSIAKPFNRRIHAMVEVDKGVL